ncbi:hypothetical protein PSEUDO8AS_20075 [Pseudomonas sp. 8AS]|nr:hypothetical protein PSEUDO8AS_20075 [Pseudomonas sp. 8AS]
MSPTKLPCYKFSADTKRKSRLKSIGSENLLNQRSNHNASDEVERTGPGRDRRYHPAGFCQRTVRIQGLR